MKGERIFDIRIGRDWVETTQIKLEIVHRLDFFLASRPSLLSSLSLQDLALTSFRLIGFHSVLREYRHTARNLQTRAKITLPVYLCDRNDRGRTCN